MPIPADLQRLLDEYLDTLPFYKRWTLRAALAITQPKAAALGCLVIVVIVIIVALGISGYASLCTSGTLPAAACP